MSDEKPKRTPLTDAQLDELSVISESDVDRAVALWNERASPEFRELLEAKAVVPHEKGKRRRGK